MTAIDDYSRDLLVCHFKWNDTAAEANRALDMARLMHRDCMVDLRRSRCGDGSRIEFHDTAVSGTYPRVVKACAHCVSYAGPVELAGFTRP